MRIGPNGAAVVDWTPVPGVRMREADSRTGEVSPGVDLERADDRALVQAFLDGTRSAFDEIVRRHQQRVYHVCYRFVGNHEDAADLAQDVFVRAFKGLRNFKGDSALGTWLYRVGVNVCLNRVAVKRPPMESIAERQPVDETSETAFDRVAKAERSAVLRQAIERLPPKQRATVVLRVYEDLSHEQIAQILGSSVGAVKANFFHALGNLRRALGSS